MPVEEFTFPGLSRFRGRKGRKTVVSATGRWTGSCRLAEGERASDIAFLDTLKAAALRRSAPGGTGGPLIRESDLRKKLRKRRGNLFIIFAVDASDSMDSALRISAAKGAVLSVLRTAYISRDRVALIVFRNLRARLVLPPTSSMTSARRHLRKLATGGATPLADALKMTLHLAVTEQFRNPLQSTVLFLLTDGEANVPLVPGGNLDGELSALASGLRKNGVRSYVIDTGGSEKGGGRLRRIAGDLKGTYKKIASPGELTEALREGVSELDTDGSVINPT